VSLTVRSTCFNHARYVVESLESIRRQPVDRFQWFIVADASEDASAAIIRSWIDRNLGDLRRRAIAVEFIHHGRNVGFARTLVEIGERATGTYLCGLACDDRMLPHRVPASVAHLDA